MGLGRPPRAARNSGIVVAVALAAALAAVVLPAGGRTVVWSVAGALALIFGLSGLVYRSAGQERAPDGRELARWRCRPDEWRMFVEAEWGATHGAYYRRIMAPSVAAGVLGGAALWWLLGPWVGLPFGLGFSAFPLWADRFHRWFAGRDRDPAEVVITDRGVRFEETVVRWRDEAGEPLVALAVLEEGTPAVLTVGAAVEGPNGGWGAARLRLPVPAGREPEARMILARLQAMIAPSDLDDD